MFTRPGTPGAKKSRNHPQSNPSPVRYHETAEAYTVQLDSSGPQDLTVLQAKQGVVEEET